MVSRFLWIDFPMNPETNKPLQNTAKLPCRAKQRNRGQIVTAPKYFGDNKLN